MAHGTPTLATGKICYLEIPAADVERSSRFYSDAFGWELRTRGDGAIAFRRRGQGGERLVAHRPAAVG